GRHRIQQFPELYELPAGNDAGQSYNSSKGQTIHFKPNQSQVVSRSFTCELCCKTFNCNSNLSKHRKIHTGVKPFICPHCNKPFRQKAHLKTHLQRKHGCVFYNTR
ncbi:unnamed protein product, partial [Owenia fusiformis]